MCKIIDRDQQLRLIEDAKDDFDEVYAVIEHNRDNRDELVGLVGVTNHVLAILFEFTDEGERSYHSKTRNFDNPRVLTRRLGLTSMHSLVAC